MLEQVFKTVSREKEVSRHHIKLYQSVHLPTYFFGMSGLEPLYITMSACTCLFFGVSTKTVLFGVVVIIGTLYWVRSQTPLYRFQLLHAHLKPKGIYRPCADSVYLKGRKIND
jgi:hypothetical protein